MEIQKLSQTTRGSGKYLIYGNSGSGKTFSLSTLPLEKTLIINAEQGLRTLDEICPDISVANVESMDDIREAEEHFSDYDFIAIDSLSKIGEICLAEEMKKVSHGMKAYGNMGDIMDKMITTFLKLPQTVIFIAREERVNQENAGDGQIDHVLAPSLPGKKFAAKVVYYFDFVWAVRTKSTETENGSIIERKFQTTTIGDGGYLAKSRSQRFDDFETPDWSSLFNKLKA